MEEKKPGLIRRLLRRINAVVTWLRVTLLNLFFLLFLLIFIVILAGEELPEIPDQGALVVSPTGTLVDQLSYVDPFRHLLAEQAPENQETLVQDVIEAITYAAADPRINTLVLSLEDLSRGGISKMQEIAVSLDVFRASGKKIIAYGDSYSQDQYWLAAQADEVYLHPMGAVFLKGYGVYRSYYQQALEKLDINFHVFRVGEYKSALEPFLRNDMSVSAKEANITWLRVLWSEYTEGIARHRNIKAADVDAYINGIDQLLAKYQGNTATVASAAGLIDGVKTRDEISAYLLQQVGVADEDGRFQRVGFEQYVWLRKRELDGQDSDNKVGLIVARGMIADGKQPAGVIGGDTLAALIREARKDAAVKAVVLRVDSGGGSAFASEVIRRELELLQAAGKPLVVSMGSVAASGGYWIAALADEIWALPTTLTGSIGVFGAFPTFEKTFDNLGIHNDGVGTTLLAGAFRPDREMEPIAARAIQRSVEHIYREFLKVVADGRGLSKERVMAVAEGRVWSGSDAKELGLVDQLGGLQQAIEAAAKLADLDDYDQQLIEIPLSPREQLIQQLMGVFAPLGHSVLLDDLQSWLAPVSRELKLLQLMNDPKGVYLQCSECLSL